MSMLSRTRLITIILTHLPYRVNGKKTYDISNDIVTVLKRVESVH